jgi:hypothetical protein
VIDDDNDDALDGLLAPLAGAGPTPDPAEHPSDGTLSAYAQGKLAGAEELAVQEHLAVCGRCRDLLLEFASFLEVPLAEEVAGVADLAAAREWRALQARMDKGRSFDKREIRKSSNRRTYLLAAASILVAILGFSLYKVSQGPAKFHTLEPLDSHRGTTVTSDSVELPVTLLLKSPTQSPYPEYRADLKDKSGRLLRAFPHLHETGTFDLEIPLERGDVEPGEFQIELLGLRQGEAGLIAKYAFKVVER